MSCCCFNQSLSLSLILQDDDEVVDLAPAPPRTEEEEAEVNQLSLELNFARAELASLLNNDDDD